MWLYVLLAVIYIAGAVVTYWLIGDRKEIGLSLIFSLLWVLVWVGAAFILCVEALTYRWKRSRKK